MIGTVIVAGLASTRLVRAWFHETIGEWPKAQIDTWSGRDASIEVDPDTGEVTVQDAKSVAHGYIGELFDCPHCLGFWFTVGCVIALRNRVTRPLVLGLAGAVITSAFVEHYPGFDPDESTDD